MASEQPTAFTRKLNAPSSSFSFTAPFPPRAGDASLLKQRRVSLPSSPRLSPTPGWPFRDEMGLEAMSVNGGPSVAPDKDTKPSKDGANVASVSMEETPASSQEKRPRKKWTMEETQMLVDGCNKWGVGNWKTILNDPELTFDNRSPVDLKDRFRTYFPDAYKQHYPNAKTHLSSRVRSALPDGSSIFEKTRSKKRRPFTPEEDEALRRGYDKHGTLWASILKDPVFHAQNRRSTDLRDRFRNAFPDLYEAAGYKPRNTASKKKKGSEGLPVPVAPVMSDSGHEEKKRPDRRKRASTAPGLAGTPPKTLPGSTTCSDTEDSSGGEERHRRRGDANRTPSRGVNKVREDITPQPDEQVDLDVPTDISPVDVRHNPLDASGGISGHEMSSHSSCSFSETTDPSLPQTWPLPESTPQRQGPVWVSAGSPPPRRVLSRDVFLSSEAHSTRKGSEGLQTMIGKSAWFPEDWLSPNPRLDSSSHPDSSSSSFIGGPSPAPSSPFSFSPSSHGVMDRYDLFPVHYAAHDHDYTSSEVGYGDRDTHSAFSEADMFHSATSTYRGFTHHSNYAGDLIFATGRATGHLTSNSIFGGNDSRESGDLPADVSVRRMGLRSGLPGIDEIPLSTIRLEDRGASAGADMERREALHCRRTSSPSDEEMSSMPPDLDFHIPELQSDILASTPTSLTNPISPLPLHADLPTAKSSRPHAQAHQHQHLASSHFRSFSQPPAEHRPPLAPHSPTPQHAHVSPAATASRSHSFYDTSLPPSHGEPWRSPNDLTDLPFLDLHYYTSNNNNNPHVQTLALLQDPVVESNVNAARALDLASHGVNGGGGGSSMQPASHYHSLTQAQLQGSVGTVSPAATLVRPSHHHQRVQSAAFPEGSLLKTNGDNKRKRTSWDGVAAP